MTVIYTTDHG